MGDPAALISPMKSQKGAQRQGNGYKAQHLKPSTDKGDMAKGIGQAKADKHGNHNGRNNGPNPPPNNIPAHLYGGNQCDAKANNGGNKNGRERIKGRQCKPCHRNAKAHARDPLNEGTKKCRQ